MRILTINTGSSSIKFSVFDGKNIKNDHGQIFRSQIEKVVNLEAAIEEVIDILKVNGLNDFDVIGHRVVHGGTEFSSPIEINSQILTKLKALISLAPLHQPYNIAAIESLLKSHPKIPQIACFDTAFHKNKPEHERIFALPKKYADEGIVSYGFHGLSYQYLASKLSHYAGDKAQGKVVVAHLGNGSSMCAMKNLQSVATTMNFTALDGLMMGTRCGNIDPGVILYLMAEKNMSVQEVSNLLYTESGLKGVSGISNDVAELRSSNEIEAKKALDLFCYKAAKQLASLIPAIDGLDILVFTAGIGENSPFIRKNICEYLLWLGIEIDDEANDSNQTKISTDKSKIAVYVIATNEEKIIAQETQQLIKK